MITKIDFASPDQVRARKVISRSRAGHTGMFPSWKLQRMIHWESVHELNAFRLLDCDSSVIRFAEQPCVIEYQMDGETHTHFPDVLVETRQEKQLLEIKPDRAATREEIASRSEFLGRLLPARGYTYRVIRASDLNAQPRLRNASTLLQQGRWPISDLEREVARRTFQSERVVSWSTASSGLLGSRGRVILCRLVLEGTLDFDRSRPMSQTTSFFIKDTSDGYCSL